MVVPEQVEIDLSYRPISYFWPRGLEKHLLARVRDTGHKATIKALVAAGQMDEAAERLLETLPPQEQLQLIERTYPQSIFDQQEREIASVSIMLGTVEVISVCAVRGTGAWINYEVMDGHDGDTLTSDNTCASESPLPLGRLYTFLIGTWPFMEILGRKFNGNVDAILDLFIGNSDYYENFDALLRKRVQEQFLADEGPRRESY